MPTPSPTTSFPIVAVGASAGGFEAFSEVVDGIPADLRAAVVFIQHLPPDHKSPLADLLHTRRPDLTFVTAHEGTALERGRLYLAPPGTMLTVDRHAVLHTSPPAEKHPRHLIDTFLVSLAANLRDRAVAVVLSGTGNDGTRGAVEVRSMGGTVLVQEPRTAHFDSMPRSVIDTGSADMVLDPAGIARQIGVIAAAREASIRIDHLVSPEHLHAFFDLLLAATGYRLHYYRHNVVKRRIRRRMQLHGIGSVEEYIELLQRDRAETRELADDLMIGVTSFFRDPDAWEQLRLRVVRPLVASHADQPIRVWTPACATGEEAYSIAMMLQDELGRAGKRTDFQVFASDVNEKALAAARAAVYSGCLDTDIPSEYLGKYIVCSEDRSKAAVLEEIRGKVVFARHNVLTDPPFSKQDLIVCRNLLIYLEDPARERCIDLFHYALNENGFLFLGKAESVMEKHSLFKAVEPGEARIFQRLPGPSPKRYPISESPAAGRRIRERQAGPSPSSSAIVGAARNALLERYAPAAVAIDGRYEIRFVNGPVNRFLTPSGGGPTQNLLEQLPERLHARIRGAVNRAGQERKAVTIRAALPADHRTRRVSITISRLEEQEEVYLVAFREDEGRAGAAEEPPAPEPVETGGDALHRLESELSATRLDLQQKIEQLSGVNEELESSNEEHQAANEELQTSQEELQSLNEELVTINSELQRTVAELEQTNSDLENFQASTDFPALFLDRELHVRRYTPAMTRLIRLIPGDIGRPLDELVYRDMGPDLLEEVGEVLRGMAPIEREVESAGVWYVRTIRPYRAARDAVEGVVIIYGDVTRLKEAQEETRAAAEKLRIVADFTYDWEYWLGADGRFVYVTPSCERVTGYSREEFMEDPELYLRIIHPDDRERMATHLAEDLHEPHPETFEFRIVRRDGEVRWLDHVCRTVVGDRGRLMGRRSSNRDITDRKRMTEAIRDLARFPEENPHPVLRLDPAGVVIFANEACEQLKGLLKCEAGCAIEEPLRGAVAAAFGEGARRVVEAEHEGQIYLLDIVPIVQARYVNVYGRDITERRRAEDALRRSEALYRTLAANLPGGAAFILDRDLRYVLAEGKALERAGFSSADLEGKTVWEALDPETAQGYEPLYRQALEGKPFRHEHESHGRYYVSEGVPIRDAKGNVTHVLAMSYDITDRRRTEEALRRTGEDLNRAQEVGTIGSWRLDVRKDELTWSEQTHRIFGIPRGKAMTYETFLSSIHPDDRAYVDGRWQAALTGEPYDIEHRIVVNGRTKWVREKAYLEFDEHGDLRGGFGITQDITESKRAERERERLLAVAEEGKRTLEALLAHVPEGIIITEGVDKPITISGMLSEWTGGRMRDGIPFGGEEFVAAWGLVDPETETPIEASRLPIMRVLNEKSPVVGDVWLQRAPDGSRRYLSANAGPILDRHGEVVGCVVAWRDVTAVKENEQALQRRTEELAGANKELEAFSYSVSHDLRAPLRTMTGFSDFLMEDYGDKLDEEGKELLERIKAAGAKMNALIEDILSLSRISRQEMSIEEVDLGDMARAFVEELKRTQPERPVDIRIQENLKTRGDPRLLDVALSNLIRNAWKYTGKTENPVIELGAFERHGETVYYVRDNGAGFDMAHADNLFAPFRRLHTDTEFPGTGVGLAIVERVIRRHGGRVWAEGQVGRGACFYFTVG